MNVLAASRTAGHRQPMELDTSSTSDRSTMRRVASPALLTVTSSKFATLMNVVGTVADGPDGHHVDAGRGNRLEREEIGVGRRDS